MPRLAVIADDITGALDTGVQFSKRGVRVAVVLYDRLADFAPEREDAVLVVDTESRHLSAKEAGERVAVSIRRARELGVSYFYKKTDSMLRGNVGSELMAARETLGAPRLHFIPAFPDMGRTTEGGVHRMNGTPIHQTAVASDPLDPVGSSDVREIIGGGALLHSIPVGGGLPEGDEPAICIFDGVTNEDLRRIGERLLERDELLLTAGCAGFAPVLGDLLGLAGDIRPDAGRGKGRMLTVGGSVNSLSLRQLDCAVRHGFARLVPEPALKLDPDADPSAFVGQAAELLAGGRDVLIQSVTGPEDRAACDRWAGEHGIPLPQIPHRIPRCLAGLVKGIRSAVPLDTVVIFGGDTSIAVMDALEIGCVLPERELLPGVVLSRAALPGGELALITKSGGFGGEDVLTGIRDLLEAPA